MKKINPSASEVIASIKAILLTILMFTATLTFSLGNGRFIPTVYSPNEVNEMSDNSPISVIQFYRNTDIASNAPSFINNQNQVIVVIGSDVSISTNQFHRPDTLFYKGICEAVSKPGGTVVVYPVGNPTDKSGIRCVLLPIPEPETGLTLSKRRDQLEYLKTIRKKNEKSIHEFLKKIQIEMFADSPKQWQTDINSFFERLDVLLLEPQHQSYNKFVLVVSDGVQSINNKDVASKHKFKCKNFNLCLCGWKTAMPDSIEATQFEDIDGFLQYINQNVKL